MLPFEIILAVGKGQDVPKNLNQNLALKYEQHKLKTIQLNYTFDLTSNMLPFEIILAVGKGQDVPKNLNQNLALKYEQHKLKTILLNHTFDFMHFDVKKSIVYILFLDVIKKICSITPTIIAIFQSIF